jgi:CO dehydrogenase maturation factor
VKLAVTGKGGVGKTTLAALLCTALARDGYEVFAIDADPNATLLGCLGHPAPETVEPLVKLADLIEERTGARPGSSGGMFRMNPFVADIPATYAQTVSGVRVLVAGAVKTGGSGCYCPENAMVRALISHLLLDENVALVVDMEAGIEHLSRGTVDSVDQLVIVTEPSRASVETVRRIRRLAADIRLQRVVGLGNRLRSAADESFLRAALPDLEFAGFIPYDERIGEAERSGRSPAGASPAVDEAVGHVVRVLADRRNATPVQ